MAIEQAVQIRPSADVAERVTSTISELRAIRTFIGQELKDGTDFGTIPGTQKPTMLLPGAQKVSMYFNARPELRIERQEIPNGHVEYTVTCELVSRGPGGTVLAQGVGSCTTMESKYRFRNAGRECPKCHKQGSLLKSKQEPGFFCWIKKDGCGAKFGPNDPAIVGQVTGKVENENIYDARNTVLKIAKKRAQVDAALGLGCMSEFFTQDLEDQQEGAYDIGHLREVVEPDPQAEPVVNGNGTFVEAMRKERERVGQSNYMATLGLAGFEKAEEVLDRARQVEVYKAMQALPTQTKTSRTKEKIKGTPAPVDEREPGDEGEPIQGELV